MTKLENNFYLRQRSFENKSKHLDQTKLEETHQAFGHLALACPSGAPRWSEPSFSLCASQTKLLCSLYPFFPSCLRACALLRALCPERPRHGEPAPLQGAPRGQQRAPSQARRPPGSWDPGGCQLGGSQGEQSVQPSGGQVPPGPRTDKSSSDCHLPCVPGAGPGPFLGLTFSVCPRSSGVLGAGRGWPLSRKILGW